MDAGDALGDISTSRNRTHATTASNWRQLQESDMLQYIASESSDSEEEDDSQKKKKYIYTIIVFYYDM
jgi:hypothetical protein